MIMVKLISGLGNQLFQYAVARDLAIRTGQELKLDTSFFNSQSLRSYRLNHFNIQATIASEKEIDQFLHRYNSRKIANRIVRNIGSKFPRRYHRLFKEQQEWQYEPEIKRLNGNKYLHGYWQHYKYFDSISPQIFDELTVRESERQPFATQYAGIQKDEKSVSIHIRRGDYVTDPEANVNIGVLPLHYYAKALDMFKKELKDPSFYVFSDDLDWAKNNLKLPGLVSYMDLGNADKDYIELELMSFCRHNIIANSSFSWWGAFLNRNPKKTVVAPADWVRHPDVNARIKIQFPNWVKI